MSDPKQSSLLQDATTRSLLGLRKTPAETRLIDKEELLLSLGGSGDLLCQVIEAFLSEADTMLADIRGAIEGDERGRLGKAAHKLKGAVTNFRAKKVSDIATKLEEISATDKLAVLISTLNELETGIDSLKSELVDLKNEFNSEHA